MKYLIFIVCLLFCAQVSFGQKETVIEKGVVTYVTPQNVYVKFASTEFINKGDTLFVQKGAQMLPALLVKDKSSTSCVCTSLSAEKMKVGDAFVSKSIVVKVPEKSKDKTAIVSDSASKAQPKVKPVVKTDGATVFKE